MRDAGAKLKADHAKRGKTAMIGGRDSDTVDLECPECGARVHTTVKAAEKGKVRCPRGHEFAVMGMLGGLGGPGEPSRK